MKDVPVRDDRPTVRPSLEREIDSAYHRREIEALRARLVVAQRKSGEYWDPPKKQRAVSKKRRAKYLLERPVKDLEWYHLDAIGEGLGQEAACQAWVRICERAHLERDAGSTAASVVLHGHSVTPFERASFLSLRASIIEEWRPRPGPEAMLVDHLVQAQWAYEHWMAVHMGLALIPQMPEPDSVAGSQAYGAQSLKLQVSEEAEEHSFRMATRWQNHFLRIIRALRDFRRMSPIVVQNAAQVNVGQQQVNVASSE